MEDPFRHHLISQQHKQRQDAIIESWACSLAEIGDVCRRPNQTSSEQHEVVVTQVCVVLMDHNDFFLDDDKTSIVAGSSSMSSHVQQLAQTILDLACQKRQGRHHAGGKTLAVAATTNNNPGMSFSWFDQLQATSPRVAIEDIECASTIEEKLQLLLQIEYVEDVNMDWNIILPILQRGVQAEIQKKQDDVNQFPFLGLIRTWYRQCRSSPDMVTFQYDLCITLMEAILVSNRDNASPLFQSWHDIWLDIMTNFYDTFQPNLERMEWMALLWLRLKSDGETETCSPISVLASLDPAAKWFSCWMMHYTTCPCRILAMLQQSKALPYLCGRLNPSSVASQVSANPDADRKHSLAMLCSVLRTIRVNLFPWNLLDSCNEIPAQISSNDIIVEVKKRAEMNLQCSKDNHSTYAMNESCNTSVLLLFVFIWSEITRMWTDENNILEKNDDGLICTFIEGLGALLWGCWTDSDQSTNDEKLFRSLLIKMEQRFYSGACSSSNSTGADSTEVCRDQAFRGQSSAIQLLNVLSDIHDATQIDEDTQQVLRESINKIYAVVCPGGSFERTGS